MRNRDWADSGDYRQGDFLCGLIGGAVGFFNFPGWLLVYFGWASLAAVLALSAAAGLAFGLWLARAGHMA